MIIHDSNLSLLNLRTLPNFCLFFTLLKMQVIWHFSEIYYSKTIPWYFIQSVTFVCIPYTLMIILEKNYETVLIGAAIFDLHSGNPGKQAGLHTLRLIISYMRFQFGKCTMNGPCQYQQHKFVLNTFGQIFRVDTGRESARCGCHLVQ